MCYFPKQFWPSWHHTFGFVFNFTLRAHEKLPFLGGLGVSKTCDRLYETQKTRISQKKVNDYKSFNVQSLKLGYNSISNDKHYEFNFRITTNYNQAPCSDVQGEDVFRHCSFPSINKKSFARVYSFSYFAFVNLLHSTCVHINGLEFNWDGMVPKILFIQQSVTKHDCTTVHPLSPFSGKGALYRNPLSNLMVCWKSLAVTPAAPVTTLFPQA